MADPDAQAAAREVLSTFLSEGNDLGDMRDALPALTEFLSVAATPDFTCVMVPLPPTPEVEYPGVEGVSRAWSDWGEAFETLRAELEEVREAERHIVILVTQIAVTRHGGVEIRQPSAMVFAFDDAGRVTRAEFHLDQDAALRAAGLA
jgi:ketosteroid isomerase-like protein